MAKAFKIGLVENDAEFRRRLEGMLRELPGGYEVRSWPSAELFWRDEAGRRQDLLFLDIVLPYMNGVELAGRIARRDPDQIVLMLTNMNSDDLIFESLRNGAMGYILKSELENLERVVATARRGGAIITKARCRLTRSYLSAESIRTPSAERSR